MRPAVKYSRARVPGEYLKELVPRSRKGILGSLGAIIANSRGTAGRVSPIISRGNPSRRRRSARYRPVMSDLMRPLVHLGKLQPTAGRRVSASRL